MGYGTTFWVKTFRLDHCMFPTLLSIFGNLEQMFRHLAALWLNIFIFAAFYSTFMFSRRSTDKLKFNICLLYLLLLHCSNNLFTSHEAVVLIFWLLGFWMGFG